MLVLSLSLSLLPLLSLASTQKNEVILTRRQVDVPLDLTVPVSVSKVLNYLTRTEMKYAITLANYARNVGEPYPNLSPPLSGFKKSKRQRVLLTDQQQESFWTGIVSIGTPASNYVMLMDTGSADFWVAGSSGKWATNAYKIGSSSTGRVINPSNSAFQITYADGSGASGPIYTEKMVMGYNTARYQIFSPVASATGFVGEPNDGIVGFGYPAISSIKVNATIFGSLYAQGNSMSSQFTFALGTTYGNASNELWYGGTDSSEPFVYTNVTTRAYWQIIGSVYGATSSTALLSGVPMIIDTGTTIIIATQALFNTMWKGIPGYRVSTNYPGYAEYPCSSTATFSFSFAGSTRLFVLPVAYLNLGYTGTSYNGAPMCLGAVAWANTGVNGIIMGDSFLRSVRATFDIVGHRVGFAAF